MSTDISNSASFGHLPVLLESVLDGLCIKPDGRYLDCTLGRGGHSEGILKASNPNGTVIGIDRDQCAIDESTKRLAGFGSRFKAVHDQFSAIGTYDFDHFDGILIDLGVSSPQLDRAERGFSFNKDGPLDMRMDQRQENSAEKVVNELPKKDLIQFFFKYGEEPRSRRIANAIVSGRPWKSTLELAQCIEKASGYRNSRTHPATRIFQAIRIVVNDELKELSQVLDSALNLLKPGGRLAVISFHSLEDRIVKVRFKDAAGDNSPKDAYGNPIPPPIGRIISRKGISGKTHDASNPRARSARLRLFEKYATESLI